MDKWDVVAVLAAALAAAEESDTGVRLYAAVVRHRERRGEESPRLLWRTRQRTHGALDRALVSEHFAGAAAEGRRLTLQEAVTLTVTKAHEVTATPRGPTRSAG